MVVDVTSILPEERIMARGRKTAISITLAAKARERLEGWQRSTTARAGPARRGRIILLVADGVPISDVSRIVGISRRLVYKWVERYLAEGTAGLQDKPRSGRPPSFSPRGRDSRSQDCLRAA